MIDDFHQLTGGVHKKPGAARKNKTVRCAEGCHDCGKPTKAVKPCKVKLRTNPHWARHTLFWSNKKSNSQSVGKKSKGKGEGKRSKMKGVSKNSKGKDESKNSKGKGESKSSKGKGESKNSREDSSPMSTR